VADHEGVFRDLHLPAAGTAVARRELFQVDARGHDTNRCGHTAFLQQIPNAFAGREDLIGEVGVACGEFNGEPLQRG
jgi:hypothetical protein